MMRDTVHSMLEQHEPGLKTLSKDDWWEFETFLFYWLSALFVLVEGFNKLKLKDARVQKLSKEHVRHLKMVRHATYHFVLELGPGHVEMIGQLWAEQLHNAIGDEVIKRKHTLREFWRRGRRFRSSMASVPTTLNEKRKGKTMQGQCVRSSSSGSLVKFTANRRITSGIFRTFRIDGFFIH
jgi:hypothetical protein